MFREKCSWVIASRRFGFDPFISGLIFGLHINVELKRACSDENATICIFSIKRRTPNKRRVYRAKFKINAPAFIRAPGVYLRFRRLFETGILNQDYVS